MRPLRQAIGRCRLSQRKRPVNQLINELYVNRINNVAYTMQYVIDINIVNVRWTHNDRWSAHNLINNIICNYLLLSLVINSC
jgi:hypothetical protein